MKERSDKAQPKKGPPPPRVSAEMYSPDVLLGEESEDDSSPEIRAHNPPGPRHSAERIPPSRHSMEDRD